MDFGAVVVLALVGLVLFLFVRGAMRRHQAAADEPGAGGLLGTLGTLAVVCGLVAIAAGAFTAYRGLGAGPRGEGDIFLTSIGIDTAIAGLLIMLVGALAARLQDHMRVTEAGAAARQTELAEINRTLRQQIARQDLAPVLARLLAEHPEPIARRAIRMMAEGQANDTPISETAALDRAQRDEAYHSTRAARG